MENTILLTSELTCPSCAREARFREVYGPDDAMHLECTLCGKPTDELELALAQESEESVCDYCGLIEHNCHCGDDSSDGGRYF